MRRFQASAAAVIDDVAVGAEHAAENQFVAQKLPDVLDRVGFGALGLAAAPA